MRSEFLWVTVCQMFTLYSEENRMKLRARCWLLSRHRLATREEERRFQAGRLSMILSIISWGSESMTNWQSGKA